MPFAIKVPDDNYMIHSRIALCKKSGMVKCPQLFYNNRPILYSGALVSTSTIKLPIVTSSSKWVCYCANPTQSIYQYNIEDYDVGGYDDMYRILTDLSRNQKTDRNSGLTVAVKGIKNNDNVGWTNTSLRITRTSISTSYLNVFSWAWYNSISPISPNTDIGQWSNDADYINAETANVFLRYNMTMQSSYKINGVEWKCVYQFGTISKASSGTYLYVTGPWSSVSKSVTTPGIQGWGIVLQPTNTNDYP